MLRALGAGGDALERCVEAWSEPRALPLSPYAFSATPPPVGSELARWVAVFARRELEAADPAEVELRAPGDLPPLTELLRGGTGPSTIADLVGAFSAATLIAQQDELSWLASWAPTASGANPVYAFHPDDWGLFSAEASMSLLCLRIEIERRRVEGLEVPEVWSAAARAANETSEPLPAHLEPVRLARRADWIVRALLGLEFGRSLELAADLEDFERERPLLEEHAHLALHWLCFHGLLGNAAGFEEVCAQVPRGFRYFDEARDILQSWLLGEPARLGRLDLRAYEALRSDLRSLAPSAALETPHAIAPEAQARLELGESEDVQAFLRIFDHLAYGGAPGPEPLHGMSEVEMEEALADKVQADFQPLLEAALQSSLPLPDHDPRAGRGRILAYARLFAALEPFERALERLGGTEALGPRRRDELWRAIASFSDPAAHARIVDGARAFAAEAEDWIRTASKVPWDTLLSRDALETHELVTRCALELAQTPVTLPILVEIARAARRHHIERAVPGLRRAVAGAVGRVDDGSRTELAVAITELDEEAGPFLSAVLGIVKLEWETAEDEDDALDRARDLACVVGPLLSILPGHLEARAAAAALLARFAVELGPSRVARASTLEALRALVDATGQGEIRAFAPTIRAIARLQPRVPPSAEPAWRRLQASLEQTLETLG